ncbi:OmpA family protein [Myroides sp. 1354]|uniref:OmpA family protein n=1 Tax=unclassified Myroides TaxID=2642485 RepID=UPI002575580A|nr:MULTISPECIES: OmpA family protein [unclassified Myroides]MDM1044893.1 OmpA family protein [Myroides sp. R163-1]MDM1055606.1 OmpA family protein [Myroides sp. 1354]MDM1068903.1 OmpA family protein [Myroides sp. 1372]
MKKIYFLVLGLSLLGTQQFYAQSIHGTFYNKENNGIIEEARVSFYNDKGQKVLDMMVDQEGKFEINSKNIEKVQKIVGTAEGFNSAEVVVNNILDDLEVNFNLTKEIGGPRKSKELSGSGTGLTATNAKTMLPFYIQYDFNSSYFNDDNRVAADELVRYMKQNAGQSVVIRSYVETRNNAHYNTWMGERRAQRVIDYLIENGISANRLIKDVVHLSQSATSRDGSTGTARDFRRCDFLIQ